MCHLLGRDQERQDLKPGGAKGVVSDFVVCLVDNEPFETEGLGPSCTKIGGSFSQSQVRKYKTRAIDMG